MDNTFSFPAPIAGGIIRQCLKGIIHSSSHYLSEINTINVEVEVIRQHLQANQPVEHDIVKWKTKIIPFS